MTLLISSVFTYDEDAGNYIQAVEAADGQALLVSEGLLDAARLAEILAYERPTPEVTE